MKIVVFGGDGFCGWPTALRLSRDGHAVTIVDNLSHRRIDTELGVTSLTPIRTMPERLDVWHQVSGRTIDFVTLDLATDYHGLRALLADIGPDAVVHFAEQRSAPYSMRDQHTRRYTVDNNINATHNLLVALVDLDLDIHVVHLGTMGVYGYDGDGLEIPEGYLDVEVTNESGQRFSRSILYPTQPGSVYHLTKSLDQLLFQCPSSDDLAQFGALNRGALASSVG